MKKYEVKWVIFGVIDKKEGVDIFEIDDRIENKKEEIDKYYENLIFNENTNPYIKSFKSDFVGTHKNMINGVMNWKILNLKEIKDIEENKNIKFLNIDEILTYFQKFYQNDMKNLEKYFKEQKKEYRRAKNIFAMFIKEGDLNFLFNKTRDNWIYDRSEFFYHRETGLIISGAFWHNSLAKAICEDIYPEECKKIDEKSYENIRNGKRSLDIADIFMDKGVWGFKSSVSFQKMMFNFSMTNQEKIVFANFI